ncbi:MAG: AraC family transcriptional regulator [Syntrophobacteraceae bacterium]
MTEEGTGGRRETRIDRIDLLTPSRTALTLEGRMETHSTRRLHSHGHHQLLTIRDGVTLLVDAARKQPLFGAMTAFIPAHLPHRSVVMGDSVRYKCLYLATELFEAGAAEISIFNISALGAALFERLVIRRPGDLASGLNRECLELLLKVLREDMERPADLVRLPEPSMPLSREVTGFIEKNYTRRLTMADFAKALPYSARHLSRLFKADLGITIFEHLRLHRMLTASIALCNTAKSITDIACDCGCESISSFYRDFHAVFALTPKAFRERMRGSGRRQGGAL